MQVIGGRSWLLLMHKSGKRFAEEASLVAERDEAQQEPPVLRHWAANQAASTAMLPTLREGPRSPDQPLDSSARGFKRPRFGYDFSRVPVHMAVPTQIRSLARQVTPLIQRQAEPKGAQKSIQPKSEKAVTIDLISLPGSIANPYRDLEFANTVFRKCGVRFTLGQGISVDRSLSDKWLGGDTMMRAGGGNGLSDEETATFDGATQEFALSSRIRAFFADSPSPGFSIISANVPSTYRRFVGVAVVPTALHKDKTLAHECGHILLNDSTHPCHLKNNLMCPSSHSEVESETGTDLTPEQCATIYQNA
jgi:hypothetical protein